MAATLRLDRALAALAVLLLAGGLAVAVAPGGTVPVPGSLRSLDQGGTQTTVEWVVAIVLGLYVCWRLLRGPSTVAVDPVPDERGGAPSASGRGDADAAEAAPGDPDPFGSGDDQTDANRTTDDARVAGAALDGEFRLRRRRLRSASGAPEPEPVDGLRNTAVALQHARGLEVEAAREFVERGDWTDDPVAAAFLGGPDAGRISLPRRLLAICYPAQAFDRRLERTIDELERAADRDGPESASNDARENGVRRTDAGERSARQSGARDGGVRRTDADGSGGV